MTTVVSFSELSKYQTCERQYYYGYVLGRVPLEESEALATGIKGHRLLQSFYELMHSGKSKEEALDLTLQSAKSLINSDRFNDFSLIKAWTMVDNYIRETDFTSEAIIVENRFLLPVSKLVSSEVVDTHNLHDVAIGFTPDVVFQRKGNMIDVEDAKFVQRAWTKKKINRFPQTRLYQIFLEQMGYDISRSQIRFFNVTTAKITTQPYTLTDTQRHILIRDFMKGVIEVLNYKRQEPSSLALAARTMNYGACQFCPFEFPCDLESEGKSAINTLKNMYKDNTYDYTS